MSPPPPSARCSVASLTRNRTTSAGDSRRYTGRDRVFITGTDTGVGKTHVTALLLAELRRRGRPAAAFKPIACGSGGRHDAATYWRLMDIEQPLNVLNPVYLPDPVAPSVAARLARQPIDFAAIHRSYATLTARYKPVLVEGAGGLLVPIKKDYFVADLARDLKLPLVIVARLGLGTINHTLLTVRQAQAMGLTVRGIILNDLAGTPRGLAEETNIRTVPALCGVPLLGVVPHGIPGARAAARLICNRLFGRR
jgi:dethiobiotin synthetase